MTRSAGALKADLDDYAHDDGHQMVVHGDLHPEVCRRCSCGFLASTTETVYVHMVPIGAVLFCQERGLPESAAETAVRLVFDGFNAELDDLEAVLRGLLP